MQLRTKFVSGVGLSVAAALLVLTMVVNYYVGQLIVSKEQDYNLLLESAVNSRMDAQLDSAQMSVQTIAGNPRIQELFAQRDREQLAVELIPVYDVLKEEVAQIQFHLPNSDSFLRLHMPENYGDSLKEFRFTVNEANESQRMVRGLEEGRGGYGFRVVVPMFYQGRHTGSFEYGSNFGEGFLAEISASCENSIQISRKAAQQSTDTTEVIDTLSQSSQKISKIINVINDIAGQTNMLALNAAIEADDAGEAGKGVGEIARASEELSLASEEVARNTENAAAQMTEVTRSTEEIGKGTEEISASIFEIDEEASASSKNADKTKASAEQLAFTSEKLILLLKKFSV